MPIFNNKSIISKIKECTNHDEQFKIFKDEVIPKFNILPKTHLLPKNKKGLSIEDIEQITKNLKNSQDEINAKKIFDPILSKFKFYLENAH